MVYRTTLAAPVFGLRREIDRLFEDTFGRDVARTGWVPAVDVREDAKEIVLELELPGIKPRDVEVTAENGVLTVRGEKRSTSSENSDERYHVIERTYGTFSRSFQLPQGVDEQRIEAEFADGLLQVHVPKAALPQPRRIEIRDSGSQRAVREGPAQSVTTAAANGASGGSPGARGATSEDGSGDATATKETNRVGASRPKSRSVQ